MAYEFRSLCGWNKLEKLDITINESKCEEIRFSQLATSIVMCSYFGAHN